MNNTQYDDQIVGAWLVAVAKSRARIEDVVVDLDNEASFFEARVGTTHNGYRCAVIRCHEADADHFNQILSRHGFEQK